jgi:hypothetical protein
VEVAKGLRFSPPSLSRRSLAWSALRDAIDRSRDRGREPVLWWRDDDAVADTPALDRLLRLAHEFEAGLALAAIPLRIEPSLPARLRDEPCVSVLVHGYRHANHASPGDKKAEFGAGRLPDVANRELHEGLEILTKAVGDKLLRVFVPPWNRIAAALVPALVDAGFEGLSTFRERATAHPEPGLLQINTHVDPIDWHGTRSLRDGQACVLSLAAAINRQSSRGDDAEPVGLLTHHLVHDDSIWWFCEDLLKVLAEKSLRLTAVKKLLCDKIGNVVEP